MIADIGHYMAQSMWTLILISGFGYFSHSKCIAMDKQWFREAPPETASTL